jgi:predicted HTH domain antitoxin
MTMQALNLGRLTIETETLETLNLLAQWQSTSRAQVIQRLLRDGARQAKIEHAAGLYGRGELTLERAALMAGVSIYDMMAHVRAHGILPPGDLGELQSDVASMLARRGHDELAQQVLRAEQITDER